MKSALVKTGKFFVQGLIFSGVSMAFAYLWATYLDTFTGWTQYGATLGVFVLAWLAWGFANPYLLGWLWFPARKGVRVALAEGALLFVTFLLFDIVPVVALFPALSLVSVFEAAITLTLIFVLYAFVDGYLARSIGAHWKVRGVKTETTALPIEAELEVKPDNPEGLQCPRCHGTNLVIATDRSGFCIDCRRGIPRQTYVAL